MQLVTSCLIAAGLGGIGEKGSHTMSSYLYCLFSAALATGAVAYPRPPNSPTKRTIYLIYTEGEQAFGNRAAGFGGVVSAVLVCGGDRGCVRSRLWCP